MLTIVDAIIILFIITGGVIGFKAGVIKSSVSAIGTIVVLILSFLLKNPIYEIFYENLPFFKFGILKDVPILNVLLYEAFAFLVVFLILSILLNFLIKISGFMESILKATIILSIPSKLLGLLFGIVEYYIICFVILMILSYFPAINPYINDSIIGRIILTATPIASNEANDITQAVDEIISLTEEYNNTENKNEFNLKTLDVVLKYDILTTDSAKNLIADKKLAITNAESIINKYETEEK